MTPVTMPIKKIVLVFQVLILVMVVASCKHQEPQKVLLLSIYGGTILNGNVKEVFRDDAGLFELDHFDRQGSLKTTKRWRVYFDDDSNKQIKTDTEKIEYFPLYDNNGDKIAITANSSSLSKQISKWVFNKSGRVINFMSDITDTLNHLVVHYKYNTSGDMIEERILGTLNESSAIFKYDVNHWLIGENFYNKNSLSTKVTFTNREFDSHKNWVKCIIRVRNYPPIGPSDTTFAVTRKITYY